MFACCSAAIATARGVAGDRPLEETMQNWKKALALSGIGAGTALLFSGRRSLGLASIAGGVALLASEYPEHFVDVWENTPDYVHRASQVFATLSRLSEKFAESAERSKVISFDDAI
jgi:hypothetical protein